MGYYNGYDAYTNPSVASGFSSSAFRFGHSLLPSTIERWSKTHRYVGSQRLCEMLQQPYDLYKGGWTDNYIMGMINQVIIFYCYKSKFSNAYRHDAMGFFLFRT